MFWSLLANALSSRNLWLLVALLEVCLTLLSPVPGDVRKPLLNVVAGLLSSAVLLAVIGLAWAVMLKRLDGPSRLIAAVPCVLVAGAARGVALQWLLTNWGMSPAGIGGYQYRVMSSVLVVLLAATTGALLKVAVEGHRARLEMLAAEQHRLALILNEANDGLASDQGELVEVITADLTSQLTKVAGTAPPLAIDSLEQLAAGVVRPLSHELAVAMPTWEPPELSSIRHDVQWSRVWGSMASVSSVDPVGPTLITLLVLPTSILILGLPAALVLHGVAAVLVFCGLWILRTFGSVIPAPEATTWRFASTAGLLVVACTPAAVSAWFLSTSAAGLVNAMYLLIVTPIAALLLSFIRATRVQQREIDEALTRTVEQTQWWIYRARMAQWWHRGTAARALHGPVQSSIYAAVQRLRAAVDDDTATLELVESILDDIRRTLPTVVVQRASEATVRTELAALATAWKPLVVVTYSVDEETAKRLETDPVCAGITLDVAVEAVSNAVRHGDATRINVGLTSEQDRAVSIEIHDDGNGWESAAGDQRGHGLGVRQLDMCALRWAYASTPGANRFTADFPLLHSQ